MLEDMNEPEKSNEYNNDEYSSDDDSDDTNSDYDGPQPSGEDEGESPATKFPVRDIGIDTPLLWRRRTARGCPNATLAGRLWGKAPTSFKKLNKGGMGMLSQLAHICVETRLQPCNFGACMTTAKEMNANAPACRWAHFRQWAVTAMSCQATMDSDRKQCTTKAYAHIASAVNSCSERVKACTSSAKAIRKHLKTHLEGQGGRGHEIDLNEVMNVIYWMAMIQGRRGIGPRKFGHWVRMLPYEINLPPVGRALRAMEAEGFNVCQNRIWKLVDASDRKQDDLADIVKALQSPGGRSRLQQDGHELCTANKCQQAHKDAGDMQQLHKCSVNENEWHKCRDHVKFPLEHLLTALEQEEDTAWHWPYQPSADWTPRLVRRGEKYMAISHVWGNGTGAGKKEPGLVNACLYNYFAGIAKEVGCTAIWWDVVSIPPTDNSGSRNKALNKMHHNYDKAACIVIHDKSLLELKWTDDGMPCLALVLSSWFTRAWTALELTSCQNRKMVGMDSLSARGKTDVAALSLFSV